MHYVTSVKHIENYKIEVVFNDKMHGIVDLESTIKNDTRPIFQELRDLKKFQQIDVGMDTVIWKNGLDLAPEFLYNKLQK